MKDIFSSIEIVISPVSHAYELCYATGFRKNYTEVRSQLLLLYSQLLPSKTMYLEEEFKI